MNKKLTTILLSSSMLLSPLSAMAANALPAGKDGDIYTVNNQELFITGEDVALEKDEAKNQEIALNPESYLYRINDKFYNMDDANAAYAAAGLTTGAEFIEELSKKTEVEVEAFEVIDISAITETGFTVELDATPSETPTAEDFDVTVGEETIEVTEVDYSEEDLTVTLTVDLSEKSGVLTVNGFEYEEEINFVTPEEVVAAQEAITAYEEATIATYADIAGVEELEAAAQEAIDAVEDEEVQADLQAQLDAQTEVFTEQLNDVVEAVTTAAASGSVINTRAELDAFGFEYETLVVGNLEAIAELETVQAIQAFFLVNNFNTLIDNAVSLGATADDTQVDDFKLYEALQYGVEAGLLENVNFDKYFTTYVATIEGFITGADLTAEGIQTNVVDSAAEATVANAVAAVGALDASSENTDITAAEALVAVVDADSVFADDAPAVAGIEVAGENVQTALTAIIEDVKSAKLVYDVIEAAGDGAINQSQLNTALQNAAVERAYEDYIVRYATAFGAEGVELTDVDTLSEIQTIIDGVNDAIAQELVTTAVGTLGEDDIAAAEAAIDRLLADDEDPEADGARTDVADLREQLQNAIDAAANLEEATAAVEALTTTNEDDDLVLADGVGQDEIDAASELVEALEASDEKTALGEAIEAAQVLQDGVNLAEATAAVEALTVTTGEGDDAVTTLAEGVGQAEIDAASELVEALPADVDPATDKAVLQAAVVAAQALQDAVNLAEATAAVEALTNEEGDALADGVGQAEIDAAEALVNALPEETDTNALDTAIAAAQELLDVAAINTAIEEGDVTSLQNIIVGLENPKFAGLTSAQRAELGAYIITQANADEEDPTVYASTTEFNEAISEEATGYVDAYIADINTFNEKANVAYPADPQNLGTDATTKQEVIEAIEKVAGTDYLTGLTAVQKLDLAEAILEAKPEGETGYAARTIAQIKAIVDANLGE